MSPPISRICLQDIQCHGPVGCDAWGRPAKSTQPVTVSISVRVGLSRADHASDDLDRSLDYSKLASLVFAVAQDPNEYHQSGAKSYTDPRLFHSVIYNVLHKSSPSVPAQYDGIKRDIHIKTTLPVGTLGAAATATWSSHIGLPRRTTEGEPSPELLKSDTLYIANIHATTIIGVKEHEKTDKQSVKISLRLSLGENQQFATQLGDPGTLAHRIVYDVVSMVQETHVQTVEALIEKVWDVVSTKWKKPTMVKVLKPDAVGFVGGCGAELCTTDEEQQSEIDKTGHDIRHELDPRW